MGFGVGMLAVHMGNMISKLDHASISMLTVYLGNAKLVSAEVDFITCKN